MTTPFQEGDVVRSFDFVDRDDCYVIGKIVEIDDQAQRLTLLVVEWVVNGLSVANFTEYTVCFYGRGNARIQVINQETPDE